MTPEEFDHDLMKRNNLMAKLFAQAIVRSLQPLIESLKAAIDAARQQMSRRVGYGRAKLYRHPKRRALRK